MLFHENYYAHKRKGQAAFNNVQDTKIPNILSSFMFSVLPGG